MVKIKETDQQITQLAAELVSHVAKEGDSVVDLTLGNGHDACHLCSLAGSTGSFIGFDVQKSAVDSAGARLAASGLQCSRLLVHAGHEALDEYVPDEWRGKISAAMMNLGYLPGSDKKIITSAETTLCALEKILAYMAPEGLITVAVYRGHEGGHEEAEAVCAWAEGSLCRAVKYIPKTRNAEDSPFLLSLSC